MSEPGLRVIQNLVQNISRSVTSARQDHEAIALWVAAKGGRSDHTHIAYRREGKRLLVWMSEEGLMLNTMRVEDVNRYFQHLADPPPHWLRPRKPKSDESILETQLLNAPLSPRTANWMHQNQQVSHLVQSCPIRHKTPAS